MLKKTKNNVFITNFYLKIISKRDSIIRSKSLKLIKRAPNFCQAKGSKKFKKENFLLKGLELR